MARERGSSLMLMPAAVLVFVVLGALAVDFSNVHLGQREVIAAVQGAASDAAAASYRDAAFYGEGVVEIDERAALEEARASLAATDLGIRITSFAVTDDGRVVIAAEAPVDTIFAKALPGGPDTVTVTARASAQLVP